MYLKFLPSVCNCGICGTDGEKASDGDVDDDSWDVDSLTSADDFKVLCGKEMALLALMEKTGYSMVQENGQRKYGGPPPGTS